MSSTEDWFCCKVCQQQLLASQVSERFEINHLFLNIIIKIELKRSSRTKEGPKVEGWSLYNIIFRTVEKVKRRDGWMSIS